MTRIDCQTLALTTNITCVQCDSPIRTFNDEKN